MKKNNFEVLVITPVNHIRGVTEKLNSLGKVTYIDNPSLDEVVNLIPKYQAIFTNPNKSNVFIGKEIIDVGTKLKAICTASTGTNHIDKEYAKLNGIKILSLTEERDIINKISSTAEHAFALMLSSLRNIPESFNSVKSDHWDYEPFIGRQLDHLTIGVIGYGRLGGYFAKYAKVFGSNILVCDPYKSIEDNKINQVSLEELLIKSDVITIHVHVTKETIGMINKNCLLKMKSNVLIINTSRGDIIDEQDLIEFLVNNKKAKYATDVLANEVIDKKIDNPIINFAKKNNQVIITPHIAGMTVEGQMLAYNHAANILKKYFIK
jgi:D-3-phosphoglycerate dehydrogenase